MADERAVRVAKGVVIALNLYWEKTIPLVLSGELFPRGRPYDTWKVMGDVKFEASGCVLTLDNGVLQVSGACQEKVFRKVIYQLLANNPEKLESILPFGLFTMGHMLVNIPLQTKYEDIYYRNSLREVAVWA